MMCVGLKQKGEKFFFARNRKSDISFYFVEIESETKFERGKEVREREVRERELDILPSSLFLCLTDPNKKPEKGR